MRVNEKKQACLISNLNLYYQSRKPLSWFLKSSILFWPIKDVDINALKVQKGKSDA